MRPLLAIACRCKPISILLSFAGLTFLLAVSLMAQQFHPANVPPPPTFSPTAVPPGPSFAPTTVPTAPPIPTAFIPALGPPIPPDYCKKHPADQGQIFVAGVSTSSQECEILDILGNGVWRDHEDHMRHHLLTPPRGMRFVYSEVVRGPNGEGQWYHVITPFSHGTAELPPKPDGWIKVDCVDCQPPVPPPTSRPLKLLDSGLGNVYPTAAATTTVAG
jgi:hypothetical protein